MLAAYQRTIWDIENTSILLMRLNLSIASQQEICSIENLLPCLPHCSLFTNTLRIAFVKWARGLFQRQVGDSILQKKFLFCDFCKKFNN